MDDWDIKKIENLIKENSLHVCEETREKIIDLHYFIENKKLRREEKWQG